LNYAQAARLPDSDLGQAALSWRVAIVVRIADDPALRNFPNSAQSAP
jgi:hypothetical protein